MKGTPCPVCGEKDGACGDTPLAFPPIDDPWRGKDTVAQDTKVYLPKQHVRRGRAGYTMSKDIVVVDPRTGNVVAGEAKDSKKK